MLINGNPFKRAAPGTVNHKGLIYVLLGAVCWGTLPIFSKYVYANGSDPMTAAAWRSYIAAAAFFIWFLLDGTLKKLRLRDLPFYLGTGVVAVGGTFILYMTAVDMLSTAMAAILLYTAPSFVIILSRILYKEPITRVKVIALGCAFVGCALVTKAYDPSTFTANWKGILLGLGAGLCYSLTTVVGGKKPDRFDGRQNAGFMVMFSPVAFLFTAPPWTLALPSPPQALGYLGLALFGSVLAYVFYMKGLETGLDGGIASITATVEPVIATVLGVIIFSDSLEAAQIVGIAVVLAGVIAPQAMGRARGAAKEQYG